jgi:nitroreductase
MDNLTQQAVDEAIRSRKSVRAFLSTEIPRATIEELLTTASRSASGTNIQPWQVHVLTGEAKQRLSMRILAAFNDPAEFAKHKSEFSIYPDEWISPYVDRRRKVGWDLYTLLGIKKGDHERTHVQHAKNFEFFGAPVGMIFTIHRVLGYAAWIDYGMFLGNLMTAARGHGLHTCPQFAFAQFHTIISDELGLPPEHKILCGMSLGYEDPNAIENTLITDRAPVSEWAHFRS